MNDIELIGISGKAGTGKDFVGREILRPEGFKQYAFSWPLKTQLVGKGFDYNAVFNVKPPLVRHEAQQEGSERGWHINGRQYWCWVAGAWMRTMRDAYGFRRFYIADVRFPHEATWVRENGGKLIRMMHGDREYPLEGTPAAMHDSETALDTWGGWDAVIYNHEGTTADDIREALRKCGVLSEVSAYARSLGRLVADFGTVEHVRATADPRQLDLPLSPR